MSLENVLRASGDIGAFCATCWGVKQVDESANSPEIDSQLVPSAHINNMDSLRADDNDFGPRNLGS